MGISLKLGTQQRARGEVKAHMVRLRASRCRSRLNQMMCHTTACWLVVNNETLVRAVSRSFVEEATEGQVREKGVTLLAEIIAPDFCPSLPAARIEKDLAAA